MAKSVEEALSEAIAELKENELVLEVEYIPASEAFEKKTCKYVSKLLNMFHKEGDGYTFSSKMVYINTVDFTYKWHSGGIKVKYVAPVTSVGTMPQPPSEPLV
jgi:hypothetical protein